MYWLMEQSALESMRRVYDAGMMPTAEQLEARAHGSSRGGSELLTIIGDQAEIMVEGVLTLKADFFARWFGGGNTIYGDIIAALAEADASPDVTSITLAIDSPGGELNGLFEVLNAISQTAKPVNAVVSGMAASAAYAIAAQADTITATSRAASFGSIGVAVQMFISDNIVSIASTDAPNKRPDVSTDAGVEIIRDQLDDMHALFVETIAKGRGVAENDVNKNFGRGGMLLADAALKRDMIDTISTLQLVSNKPKTAPTGSQQETAMDIAKLKAEHPGVYAEVIALGEAQERDRVVAHLIMGEKSGATKTAATAIKDGSDMTATLQAEYMSAGMDRRDVEARTGDDDDAGAADNTNTPSDPKATDEVVADLVAAQFGV